MISGKTRQRASTSSSKSEQKNIPQLENEPSTNVLSQKKEDASCLVSKLVPLSQIVISATQPRKYFDPKGMQSLIESVKSVGILQPLIVRLVGDMYELVAGVRRYRAAKECSLKEVPVIIREISDTQAIQYALVENLQRKDLNPLEETEGILDLLALRLSIDREKVVSLLNKISKAKRSITADNDVRLKEKQIFEEVFANIGKMTPESFRTHRLPLLNLPYDILDVLRSGEIEYTKARVIAKVEAESKRIELLEKVRKDNLSLNQIREEVKDLQPRSKGKELEKHLETTYKRAKKHKVCFNPEKQEKLKKLLKEVDTLIAENK